jgi:hypothetical protein
MRNMWQCMWLLALVRSSFNHQTVQNTKQKIQQILQDGSVPDGMPEWLAALDDSIHVLSSCLPTVKDGRCYKSGKCSLPELEVDGKVLPFVLKLCKKPYQIQIHFFRPDLPWWAKADIRPIVISFNNNENDGVYTIKSHTTYKLKVKWINFGVAKGTLIIDRILRYDCTKPRGDEWKSLMKRVNYNRMAPDEKYTSIFYKLKIRIELKKKRFNWFRFNYRCKRCEDLVNESGSYGSGPPSCKADLDEYWDYRSIFLHHCRPPYRLC